MKLIFTLFLLLTFISGCTPAIRSTAFVQLLPKSKDAPIKIFRYKTPRCDFEEVGIVNSRQRNKFISMSEVMSSLLTEARKLGGDAIMGLNETNPIHNVSSEYGVDRDPVLSGTVIKFTDENCKR